MPAQILDGRLTAEKVKTELAVRVEALKARGITPCLAVILVGEDPASEIYVSSKGRMCESLGIASRTIRMPADTPQAEVIRVIRELNADPQVHGVLVQSPLPAPIDEPAVLAEVSPGKDVDGFHAVNAGRLMLGQKCFVACTPAGVMRLLEEAGIPLSGKHAVVIGRSTIVGKPVSQLLLAANCTVTVCHSRTVDLKKHTLDADILVVAIGRKHFVTADMVKPGAVVVDVGINRKPGSKKIFGDVDTAAVSEVAGFITPVPGGVGPMTIMMLMRATVEAAENTCPR